MAIPHELWVAVLIRKKTEISTSTVVVHRNMQLTKTILVAPNRNKYHVLTYIDASAHVSAKCEHCQYVYVCSTDRELIRSGF